MSKRNGNIGHGFHRPSKRKRFCLAWISERTQRQKIGDIGGRVLGRWVTELREESFFQSA